jgi:hypothetical protein
VLKTGIINWHGIFVPRFSPSYDEPFFNKIRQIFERGLGWGVKLERGEPKFDSLGRIPYISAITDLVEMVLEISGTKPADDQVQTN